MTEAKATYESLILDNAETHKKSNDHSNSNNEVVSASEMGQTQLEVEEASNEAHTTETHSSEEVDAEIKRLQRQLKAGSLRYFH